MPDRDLTPAEEEQVRRLLADARHRDPLPADVAARLDDVLAALHAEREEGVESAGDEHPRRDDLDARRRRRLIGAGLLAAAAVVVAGATLPELVGSSGLSSSADQAAGGDGEFRAAQEDEAAPGSATSDSDVMTAREATLRRLARAALAGSEDPAGSTCPRREAWGAGELAPLEWNGQDAVVVARAPRGTRQRIDLYLCGSDRLVRHTTLPTR